MAEEHTTDEGDLAAGDFTTWLTGLQGALQGVRGAEVPCGGCTACCTSSQFVHIGPDETETLAHVPAELVFPAPGLPPGHLVLGYDQQCHCPMLVDGQCSIYEHRPRTCRTYDCRIFPATGVELDADDKVEIVHRARRWRFDHPTSDDHTRHEAVRAAATFLGEHPEVFVDAALRSSPTQRAVVAVEIHAAFLRLDTETGRAVIVEPALDEVRVEVTRRLGTPRFDRTVGPVGIEPTTKGL